MKLYQAMTWRDAAIVQAASEGRYSNAEIAGMIGVSKARIGKIVRELGRRHEWPAATRPSQDWRP